MPAKRQITSADQFASLIKDLGTRKPNANIQVISTGSWTLDMALGIGGLPIGRIVEFYGDWQTAKSTIAMQTAVNALKLGGVLYLDFESGYDTNYAKVLGLDETNPRYVIDRPDSLEDGEKKMVVAIESGHCRLVVVDSLSTAPTEAELKDDDGATIGLIRAKAATQLLRRIALACDKHNCTVIFISHASVIIGGMKTFGPPPKTTTGGNALKFYASIRVEFKIREQVKRKKKRPDGTEDNAVFASKIEVNVIKNKLAPPYQKESFYVFFGRGSNNAASLLDIAVEQGIVERTSTGLFKFKKPVPHTSRGLAEAIRYVEANQPVLLSLCKDVFAIVPDLAPVRLRELLGIKPRVLVKPDEIEASPSADEEPEDIEAPVEETTMDTDPNATPALVLPPGMKLLEGQPIEAVPDSELVTERMPPTKDADDDIPAIIESDDGDDDEATEDEEIAVLD